MNTGGYNLNKVKKVDCYLDSFVSIKAGIQYETNTNPRLCINDPNIHTPNRKYIYNQSIISVFRFSRYAKGKMYFYNISEDL